MNIGPEFLVALAGVLTALATAGIALYNARHSARKDLVEILQGEVERLTQRVIELEREKALKDEQYDGLRQRVFSLEADNAALKQRVISLEAENNRLIRQNKELLQKIKAMEVTLEGRKGKE